MLEPLIGRFGIHLNPGQSAGYALVVHPNPEVMCLKTPARYRKTALVTTRALSATASRSHNKNCNRVFVSYQTGSRPGLPAQLSRQLMIANDGLAPAAALQFQE